MLNIKISIEAKTYADAVFALDEARKKLEEEYREAFQQGEDGNYRLIVTGEEEGADDNDDDDE